MIPNKIKQLYWYIEDTECEDFTITNEYTTILNDYCNTLNWKSKDTYNGYTLYHYHYRDGFIINRLDYPNGYIYYKLNHNKNCNLAL